MGIPGLGEFLRHHRVVNTSNPRLVSSVAIDFNAVLHPLAGMVFGTSPGDDPMDRYRSDLLLLRNALREYLQGVIDTFHPHDWLYLAVDGVAPLAKVINQRKRRLPPPTTAGSFVTPAVTPAGTTAGAGSSGTSSGFNDTIYQSASITPGTDFMLQLHVILLEVVQEITTPAVVIYSDHLTPGEGEHKIMDFYRQSPLPGMESFTITQGTAARKGGTHILISPDLDLIMLTLIAPLNHIVVARSTHQSSSTITYDLVDIDLLRTVLRTSLRNHDDERTVLDDFVLITLLIGNDFLSHHPAFINVNTTTNYLIEKYNQVGLSLTRDRMIRWDRLLLLFQALAADEPLLVSRITQRQYRYPPTLALGAVTHGNFYWEVFRTRWYERALGPRHPSEFSRIVKALHLSPPDPLAEVPLMIGAYLTTMDWNYRYYQSGAVNNYWYYQYDYVPFFVDIVPILEQMIEGSLVPTMSLPDAGWNDNQPLHPLYQLAAVLPYRAPQLMPSILRGIMSIDSPVADLYPVGYLTELEGIEREHQGLIILPPLDITRIIRGVNGLPLDEYILLTYESHSPHIYDYRSSVPSEIPSVSSVSSIPSGSLRPTNGRSNRSRPSIVTSDTTYEVPLIAPIINSSHLPTVYPIVHGKTNPLVRLPRDDSEAQSSRPPRSPSSRPPKSSSSRPPKSSRPPSSTTPRRPLLSLHDLGDL